MKYVKAVLISFFVLWATLCVILLQALSVFRVHVKNSKGQPLFTNQYASDEDRVICLTHVWDGKLPPRTQCIEDTPASVMQQEGARLLLLLNVLSLQRGELLLPDPADCSEGIMIDNLLSNLKNKLRGYATSRAREIRRLHDFYAKHIFFSFSEKTLQRNGCDLLIPIEGDAHLSRVT